ncbi:MAG: TetR/AcrR family transcriptional regulator [Candidatus Geothermincolales bacterium]
MKKRLPAPERRKVILQAALHTFAEQGYHGAIMETIARRANVTKPILYRHFPSKLELLKALIKETGEQLREALRGTENETSSLNWEERIRRDVDAYLSFVTGNEMGFRLIYTSDVNVNQEVVELINQIREGYIEDVAKVISSYTDTSRFPWEQVKMVATLLVGMVEYAVRRWLEMKDRSLEDYRENLIWAIRCILSRLPARASA